MKEWIVWRVADYSQFAERAKFVAAESAGKAALRFTRDNITLAERSVQVCVLEVTPLVFQCSVEIFADVKLLDVEVYDETD